MIYADFKSVLVFYQKHVAHSYGHKSACADDKFSKEHNYLIFALYDLSVDE